MSGSEDHTVAMSGPGGRAMCSCGETFTGDNRGYALMALFDHADTAIAAAEGHDGCLPCAEGSTPADHRLGDS